MPAYGLFAAGAVLLVGLVVLLARATQRELSPDPDGGAVLADRRLSIGDLYLNVVVSQLVVVGALVGLLWYTGIPSGDVGIGEHAWTMMAQIGAGLALGVLLFIGNEASVRLFDRFDIGYSEELRRSLAPSGPLGWAVLLGIVLPIIAAAEELMFRAALIGALDAGFDIPVSVLVILSSITFALGHGVQGPGGVLVTGVLGLVLAGAFVWSGSLALVVVAHYVINVFEFVMHEGLDRV